MLPSNRIHIDDDDAINGHVKMINPSRKGSETPPLKAYEQGQGQGEINGHVPEKNRDYGFFNNKYKYKKDSDRGGSEGSGVDNGHHPTMGERNVPVSAESIAAALLSSPDLKLLDEVTINDNENKQVVVPVPVDDGRRESTQAMNVETFREALSFRGDQSYREDLSSRGENLSGILESPKRRRLSATPGMPGN